MKIVLLWQGTGKENEMRYQVTMKPGETRALMQQNQLTRVLQFPRSGLTVKFSWDVMVTI